MNVRIWSCLWLVLGCLWGGAALSAEPSGYLAELQARARLEGLARQDAWLALLHYRRQPLTGHWRSLADDAGFFNAPDGNVDPAAELSATLAAFFDPRPVHAANQPAQCRFPARLNWLRHTLQIDLPRLPAVNCERFDQWRAGLKPHSVSLIFPTAYVNSPASMYGHTFLRVNQGAPGSVNPTLAYTINYAADGSESEGLAYAFKGLAGLYGGSFTTTPYYRRIEEYTHLENRDIWEYDLALSDAEIDQLLAHTWELGFTRFDYYFFDENCSYQLLSLLDVARPGLNLTDAFTWWALPVDTVRALYRVPGLVTGARFRPSNSTDMAWRASALDDATVAQAREVGLGLRPPAALLPASADPALRARALELAERYAAYRGAVDGLGEGPVQSLRMAVLGERAQLPTVTTPPVPVPIQPQEGHATGRADLLLGQRNGVSQWRLALRPAYHDLGDPEAGFQRGAHIQFGALELSGAAGQGVRLERLTPVDIISLTPEARLIGATSWKARFGLSREFGRGDAQAPLVLDINGGPGRAWELGRSQRALAFALLDNQLWWSPGAAPDHAGRGWAVGTGVHAGVMFDPTATWRLQLDAHWRYMLGRAPNEAAYTVHSRHALGPQDNLIVQCEWQQRGSAPARRECLAGWQRYW